MRSEQLVVGFAVMCLTAGAASLPVACSTAAPVKKSNILDPPDTSGADSSMGPDTSVPPDALAPDAEASVQTVCNPAATYGAGSQVMGSSGPLSTGAAHDLLGSVTPDELSIAWMNTGGQLFYADRTTASAAFGTTQTVNPSIVQPSVDRAALSPDGLSLAVVSADQRSFVLLARSTRSDAFASSSATDFATINAAVAGGPADQVVGDPLYAADGSTFTYSMYSKLAPDAGSLQTIRTSTRPSASSPWANGAPSGQPELAANADGNRKRPTGWSSDGLTLFYWDNESSLQMAAFRNSTAAPYSLFVIVGANQGANPSSDCTKLYYSAFVFGDGGIGSLSGTDLEVASKL